MNESLLQKPCSPGPEFAVWPFLKDLPSCASLSVVQRTSSSGLLQTVKALVSPLAIATLVALAGLGYWLFGTLQFPDWFGLIWLVSVVAVGVWHQHRKEMAAFDRELNMINVPPEQYPPPRSEEQRDLCIVAWRDILAGQPVAAWFLYSCGSVVLLPDDPQLPKSPDELVEVAHQTLCHYGRYAMGDSSADMYSFVLPNGKGRIMSGPSPWVLGWYPEDLFEGGSELPFLFDARNGRRYDSFLRQIVHQEIRGESATPSPPTDEPNRRT